MGLSLKEIDDNLKVESKNIKDIKSDLNKKATKDGSLQNNLNAEKIQGSRVYVSASDPGGSNNDIWLDTKECLLKVKINSSWKSFGAVYF